MDLDLIERLMQLLDKSSVHELELSENGVRIRLSKSASLPLPATPDQPPVGTVSASANAHRAEAHAAKGPHAIVSGLSGTFYRAPMPGEAPFVGIGDIVADGQKLGIVEAMKMMNPVEADCAGRIAAIHLADGDPVSAGMVLFSIDKADP